MSQLSKKIFAIKDTFVPTDKKSKSNTHAHESPLSVVPKQKEDLSVDTSSSLGSIGESSVLSNTSFSQQVEGATVVMDAPLYNMTHKPAQTLYSCMVCLIGPEEVMGQSWPINKEQISVGRSRKCDICIQEPSLSKKHLIIYWKNNNQIWVEDQNSTNGTLVNEIKLKANTPVELKDNHKVSLGKAILRFLDKDNPEIISVQENFEKAFQDSLTEISNRFALESRAPALFKQSQKYLIPLSFIIFDIDHFKKVNDTYGHLAGDFVLKEVVRVVKPCFRSKDLFARSGGEEFCIIIQSKNQRAESAIENARQKVEKHLFQYKEQKIQVTISAGVACRQKEDNKWQDLYERADKRLYKAKTAGRNKVFSS